MKENLVNLQTCRHWWDEAMQNHIRSIWYEKVSKVPWSLSMKSTHMQDIFYTVTLSHNKYSLLSVTRNYLWLQLTIKLKSASFTLAKWELTVIFVITMRLDNYYNGVDLWHVLPIRWSEYFIPQWVYLWVDP